ncbi:MAG: PEGA domain-containing protein [Nitrospirota bacterium]
MTCKKIRLIIIAALTVSYLLPLYSYGAAGVMAVHSDPSGAEVYIDGVYVGNTPYKDKEITAGPHKVLATYDDYPPQHKYVTVTEGSPQSVSFVFEKKAYSGECVNAKIEGTCWKGYWKGYDGNRNEPMHIYFINDLEAKLKLYETYSINLEKNCDGSLFKNTRGNILFLGRVKDEALEIETFNYAFKLRTTVVLDKDKLEACNMLTEPPVSSETN